MTIRKVGARRPAVLNHPIAVLIAPVLSALIASLVWAQPVPVFVDTSPMTTARANDTRSGAVAVLQNGKVLVSGGLNASGVPVTSANLYDPSTGKFVPTGPLNTARWDHMAAVLPDGRVLIAGGYDSTNNPLNTSEIYNPASGSFTPGPVMSGTRAQGTATALADGRVLVAGGNGSGTNAADLYIPGAPGAGTFSGPFGMSDDRLNATATRLPNGKVLVCGGYSGTAGTEVASCDLFDPVLNTFSPTGPMSIKREAHTATLISSSVLIAGGYDGTALNNTEVYNIAAGTFSPGPLMTVPRYFHEAVALNNGLVFFTGGTNSNSSTALNSAELFDPYYNYFYPTASMATARVIPFAVLMPSGLVLVGGGETVGGGTELASAEIYDTAPGTFVPNGAMAIARQFHTASLLSNGRVLVTGGKNAFGVTKTTELSSAAGFAAGPPMSSPRAFHTATDLGSQTRFLIAGGQDSTGHVLPSAQVYTVSTNAFTATANNMTANRLGHTAVKVSNGATKWVLLAGGMGSDGNPLKTADKYSISGNSFSASAGTMTVARMFHTATLLLDGTVLIAGGNGAGNVPLKSAELYNPGTDTFTAIAAAMKSARAFHSAVLLVSGKVLLAGGVDANGQVASAELYDPAAKTFAAVSTMPVTRDLFTATLLTDGDVLLAGGQYLFSSYEYALYNAELFDPFLNEFTEVPASILAFYPMRSARFGHTATLLQSGMVMLTGGKDYFNAVEKSTELYDPPEGPSFIGTKAALISDAPASGMPGETVKAGSFSVVNTGRRAETLNSVTMAVNQPSLFSSLTLTATIGSVMKQAQVSKPGRSVTFSFGPGLPLGANTAAMMALIGRIAPASRLVSSIQAATVVDMTGFNGAVSSIGLPVILSRVSMK